MSVCILYSYVGRSHVQVGCAHRKKNNLREHPQKYLSPTEEASVIGLDLIN